MSRNILPLSFAPRDTHEAQVQFALERGVPALIGVIASKRLPYPSRDFDGSLFTLPHSMGSIWCEMEDIMLEMDRILRPEGSLIIRDDVDMLVKVKRIADGLNWDSQIVDHEDGPLQRENLLFAVKLYWTAPASDQ
ncbi:hypothetical protein RD792_013842 [Penstemon davidsonii]|uniref:Methyltransferase n=1 Tax=Penstemon davidsonii TaxID=160366 RepID=A0ABR0CWR1_9LAMI|nr:hypothetical protein RD792_013842 [Penstemon davidsonii]